MPPVPEQRPHSTTLHGVTIEDPYHWLRDDNWQAVMRDPAQLDPAIRAHLDAENAHTDAVLADTASLQEKIFAELKGRIKEDDSSVPAKHGPWSYYTRYELGAQHPRYCRRPLASADDPSCEQVLFDADAAAADHTYFNVGSVGHSHDHKILAVAVDTKGSEFYEITFTDLGSGEPLEDRIKNCSGSAVFAADNKTVFYTVLDEHHRPCKVLRHELGTPADQDVLVYEEQDSGFFLGVGGIEDDAHIIIDSHDHVTSELRVIDARAPHEPARLLVPRQAGREVELSALGDTFLVLTNQGAEDFKLVSIPVDSEAPDLAQAQELVAHKPGRLLLTVLTFANYIVRLEREGGLPRIVVLARDSGEEYEVAFDEKAYSLGISGSYEYDTSTLRFTYSSMTTPRQTFDFDMATRTRTLRKEQEIPSGHDTKLYRSTRIEATSHDGAKVPISLLWHADTPLDGSAPVLLNGYGSYGLSTPASFSGARLSLVRRGFIYALAHIRGGKDKGYAWYRDGKLNAKKNTFEDFVAAAQHLCDANYTRAGNITIHGGSAGGMLVGAAVNLRPELFKAVVGDVPFVDVLNTMCDKDLPLTPPEWPEWGDPLTSETAFRYIASYSPYDNVAERDYPHILATAGLTDPRVTYWEPAKWVARLRQRRTNDNMLLLKTYMEAGHAGAAGRFEKLREVALVYAFVLLAHQRTELALHAGS